MNKKFSFEEFIISLEEKTGTSLLAWLQWIEESNVKGEANILDWLLSTKDIDRENTEKLCHLHTQLKSGKSFSEVCLL